MNISVKISSIFLCLIPFSLLTGPFFPDLFLSLICIIFLISLSKDSINKYFKNKFFYFFISFFIFLLISSLLSDNIIFSLKSSFVYFRFFLFSFVVWYLLDKNENLLQYFFYGLLIAYLFSLLDGYYQFFNQITIFGIQSEVVRLSLPLNEKLILGGYLARLFPLLIGLYFYCYKKKLKNYIFLGIIFIASDVLIYISGERTALGLMSLAIILIIFLISDYRITRIITFVISIGLIIFISFTNSEIRQRNIDLTINQLGFNDPSKKIIIFSPEHDRLSRSAIKMFFNKPILGHGPNMFRELCDKNTFNVDLNSCSTHPHNSYIQLLAETGLIGFIYLFISFIYLSWGLMKHTFFYYFRKQKILSNIQICIYISILLSVWPFFPTLNFFNNWINIIYFMPVGFFLHFRYTKKHNKINI